MKKRKLFVSLKNNKALSLVEVLLAVVILGLIATPLLQVFYSSLILNQKSQRSLDAADLTDTTLEFISSKVFEDYTYHDGSGDHVVDGFKTFYWGTNDNPFSNSGVNSLKLYNQNKLYPGGPSCNYRGMTWYPGTVINGDTANLKGMQVYMTDIKYNHNTYCMRIITEGDPSNSDEFFTYKVTVEVYDSALSSAGLAHQQALIDSGAANTNVVFNYSTLDSGYYDLLCSGFTYIQNKY